MSTTPSNRQHLYDLLKDFDTAMLVTRSPDGHMHSRPMAVAELRADADAFFVTSIDSPKVTEINAHPVVTLTFQSSNQYASLSGRATVVRDQALVDRLWKEAWKIWFPKGKTDPTIAMLKFSAQDGEYWDNAGAQGLKFAFEATKAYIKGETPKEDAKQHAKLDL
ncbi:MAG: pyridoxamine 5'-phosphate oxidase family protein [Pseudomonadota bacterium]|nr:pyridoxamine 5'-phosphate oxidase family protein [Pseudomonadota bacterium]